ncbi:angiopoietin-related protein 3-like [Electrophorus electricus]|uniref:angiopoietin-related protein 3-like n=1 Tax=Electrophorus electricus TaxID=8005 RepID=UPI0015CFAC7A|nr:angiopoietin-related protein 3-like [Electrophorus electricus]
MNFALLMILVVETYVFSITVDMSTEEPILAQVQTQSSFAALDDVQLIANGLLQLGKNLRDFVQKTKDQINDLIQKLNIFDSSFYQLSILASEIKEEEDELKKTTVMLKANNEEIKNLSLEINSKAEDIVRERVQLRNQVERLELKLTGLSQGLLSADQVAEISALKEVIQAQERSIAELLKAMKEQREHLNYQKNKIKSLENKLNSGSLQDTPSIFRWDAHTHLMSDYLFNYSTDGSFSSDFPKHCGEIFGKGEETNGLYAIKPNQSEPFLVYCEFTEVGAFTVIQRRQDGSVNFDRSWQSYEDGFGDFKSDFWLGLKKISSIASQGDSVLHVQMEDWKREKYLMEFECSLEGPASNYTIHFKSGGLTSESQTRIRFSTKDHYDGNNNQNCAHDYTGGWWFSGCGDINLNGKSVQCKPRRKRIQWKHNKGQSHLKSSQISFYHLKATWSHTG